MVLASLKPVPSSQCGLPEGMTTWLCLCHHLNGPRRDCRPELGQSDSLQRFLELGWENQVSHLEGVKLAGDPSSNEVATLSSKMGEKENAVCRKEQRRELERVLGVFSFNFHSSWSPAALWEWTVCVPVIETYSLCWLQLVSVTCTQRSLKNTKDMFLCSWSFTYYVSSVGEYWPF